MKETTGEVTQKGNPITLLGTHISAGHKAPNFELLAPDGREVQLSDSKGKVRLLSVVYSVDTNVCDAQTQKFEGEAAKFPDVVFYTISEDLPTADARYIKGHNNKRVQLLSDHLGAAFGLAYGLLIKGQRMLARAVIIVDKDDTVRYVEVVKEIAQLPNFDRAFEVLKSLTTPLLAPVKNS